MKKAIVAKRDIKKGEKLSLDNLGDFTLQIATETKQNSKIFEKFESIPGGLPRRFLN